MRKWLQATPCEKSAAEFLVEQLSAQPGQITVLALAACTNIALAMQLDPDLPSKWQQLVILGGAFQVGGNVNPAAEANIFGDPEAADYVLSRANLNTYVVGLDVTHDCTVSGEELANLRGARFVT
jgi:inosine-uridine nucleoside N-ribohydrolase